MVKNYSCEICKKTSSQKSHHEQHLNSETHKQAREIERLKMMSKNYFGKSGKGYLKGREKEKHIEKQLDKKESTK